MGIQMKRKELTKTFMMISIWKLRKRIGDMVCFIFSPICITRPGEILTRPGKILTRLGKILSRPGKILTRPGEILARLGKILTRPGEILTRPGKILACPGELVSCLDELVYRPGELVSCPGELVSHPGELVSWKWEGKLNTPCPQCASVENPFCLYRWYKMISALYRLHVGIPIELISPGSILQGVICGGFSGPRLTINTPPLRTASLSYIK